MDFQNAYPSSIPNLDFKRAYPTHFHYELKRIEYDTRLQAVNSHNNSVRLELGSSNVVR